MRIPKSNKEMVTLVKLKDLHTSLCSDWVRAARGKSSNTKEIDLKVSKAWKQYSELKYYGKYPNGTYRK